MIIEAIAKRKDVSPEEGKSKYGSVTFADPVNKKYPLDTEAHVRAAWSYINMPKNAAKYSSKDLKLIKARIRAAMRKHGAELSGENPYHDERGRFSDAGDAADGGTKSAGGTKPGAALSKRQEKILKSLKGAGKVDSETAQRLGWLNDLMRMEKQGVVTRQKGLTVSYWTIAAPEGKKTESQFTLVTCSLPYTCTFEGEAPSQILYLPKGRSTIHARVNGEPQTVTVEVDEGTASALETDLHKRLTQPVKPIGGFNHRQGAASFIPKGFMWDAKRGVILNVDWTGSGKKAIEDRDYSYFSPTFTMKDDRVKGLTERGEIGSLTNSPAFEHIGEIAAT